MLKVKHILSECVVKRQIFKAPPIMIKLLLSLFYVLSTIILNKLVGFTGDVFFKKISSLISITENSR